LPKTVEEALRIDQEMGTDFWRCAIEKEIMNVVTLFGSPRTTALRILLVFLTKLVPGLRRTERIGCLFALVRVAGLQNGNDLMHRNGETKTVTPVP
jgi:hypothetical protein